MREKSCFLMGNRYTPNNIKEQLTQVIEQHIREYGVNTFIVGGYGNFDYMAQGALREVKNRHIDIMLYLLAPYALTKKIETPKDFDGTLYPDGMETAPKRLAIVQANRKMVDRSAYLISYCRNNAGNTQKIVKYAQRREKKGLIKVTLIR